MKTNCVLFCRVSSSEQEETGYSLPAQEKLLKEYATRKDLKVVKIFSVAESASGAKQRLVFTEMMEYLEKQGVTDLLVEKVDRLSRNLRDAVIAGDWLDLDEDRKIHFVKQNLVLHKNAKSDEKFRWDIEIVLAKKYISNLSEEVKKGQKEKLAQGWFPSVPPLGYMTTGEKGHKTIIIDPDRAPYVARAFEYYVTGNYSLTALNEKLYEEGLRSRNGTKIGKSSLEDMLKDPFYYGAMCWKAVVYPNGKHQPLVKKELFDLTRATLSRGDAPHYMRRSFIFSKMITCGECQATIYAEVQKGHIYYSCKHYQTCSQRYSTKEEDIENAVLSVFNIFQAISVEEAEQIYQKIRADHHEESKYKEDTLKALQARYNELQRRLEVLYDDRLAQVITQERWELKQAGMMAEQEEIQSQISKLKDTEVKYYEKYINIIDLARRSREIYEKRNPEERRMLLKSIFSNLVIKDKIVSYSLKESIAMIVKRVQEKVDSEKLFEPQNSEVQKRQKGTFVPLHPAMLRELDSNQ